MSSFLKLPKVGLAEIKQKKVAFAKELAAELLGTMLLVMIGCGSAMSSQVPNILASGLSESGNNAMSGYEDDGEGGTYLVYQCSAVGFRTENISARDMDCSDLIEKTKKHLRSVLISEKGGVALDRLDRDFRELVSSFDG